MTPATKFRYPEFNCMERLIKIVKSVPDVIVVVSSTWRLFHDNAYIIGMLRKYRFPEDIKVSFTKDLGYIKEPEDLTKVAWGRGREIDEWLKETDVKVDGYLVIDDDMADLKTHEHVHVRPSNRVGLEDKDVDKAIEILRSNIDVSYKLLELRS